MKKLTILAMALSVGLTACGGSGSNGGLNSSSTNTGNRPLTSSSSATTKVYDLNNGKQNTTAQNNTTGSNNNTTNNANNTTNNAGTTPTVTQRLLLSELDMSRESTKDSPTKAFLLQEPSSSGTDALKEGINVLIVDDKNSDGGLRHIQLIPSKDLAKAGQVYRTEGAVYTGSAFDSVNSNPPTHKSWRVIGNNLKYAKYGEVYDDQEKRYLVSQGEEVTPDAYIEELHQKQAKAGYNTEIKYSGIALHTFPRPVFTDESHKNLYAFPPEKDDKGDPQSFLVAQPFGLHNAPVEGKVDFLVNFGNKTLKGDVQVSDPVSGRELTIPLKATIKGASFSGRSVYDHDHSPYGLVRTSGSFYGKNAEEMSGIYTLPVTEELKFNNDREKADKEGKYPEVSSQMSHGFGSFGAKKQ